MRVKKVTEELVKEIKEARAQGMSFAKLSKKFGLAVTTIRCHLSEEFAERRRELYRKINADGGWKKHYDKERHRKNMAKYRANKKKSVSE